MIPEDKQLLLKDLCARVIYSPTVYIEGDWFDDDRESYDAVLTLEKLLDFKTHDYILKPYLRPMSSMTEKEHKEFDSACLDNLTLPKVRGFYLDRYISSDHLHVDWLISHHFDYRGLIPMGLALEADEGMYKTE